jgi:hypothetical protein
MAELGERAGRRDLACEELLRDVLVPLGARGVQCERLPPVRVALDRS